MSKQKHSGGAQSRSEGHEADVLTKQVPEQRGRVNHWDATVMKNVRHRRTRCEIFSWTPKRQRQESQQLFDDHEEQEHEGYAKESEGHGGSTMAVLRRCAKLPSQIMLFFSARIYLIRKCNPTPLATGSATAQTTSQITVHSLLSIQHKCADKYMQKKPSRLSIPMFPQTVTSIDRLRAQRKQCALFVDSWVFLVEAQGGSLVAMFWSRVVCAIRPLLRSSYNVVLGSMMTMVAEQRDDDHEQHVVGREGYGEDSASGGRH